MDHYEEACLPAVGLNVNGVPVQLRGFRDETVAVDLPEGTVSVDVEATGAAPDALVQVDGEETNRANLAYSIPVTRVVVAVTLMGSSRSVVLLIRAGRRYVQFAIDDYDTFGSTAISASGTNMAGGSPDLFFNRNTGTVSFFDLVDGGWTKAGSIQSSDRGAGWTVSLSDDGRVLADTASYGQPLQISSRTGGYWKAEAVAAVPGPGAAAAMAGDGQMAWLALGLPDAGVIGFAKDAGVWVPVVAIDGDARSVAVSSDSATVAVGSSSTGAVRVYTRSPQGYALAQALHTSAQLGASVALSGDGAVLVASDRISNPLTAWVFERGDAGYEERLAIHPAADPWAAPSSVCETPVAVSSDGLTVAVGFTQDDSVVIASLQNGDWRVVEALLPAGPGDSNRVFAGSGVSVSGDGSRVSVACPLCARKLSVFERLAR